MADWHRLVVDPPRGSPFSILTSDQQVFNNMMRKEREWPGIAAPHGAWLMDPWDKSLKLGGLPMALFMNGHGYFVQAAHVRLKTTPIAVHATYSLDNHDALAKRQRFREAGLWSVDDDAFYAGKFLALNHSVAPDVQAAIDKYVQRREAPSNIDVHGKALRAYISELRDALALATTLGRTLILPRWTCYCDRLWSGSDDIFHFGCMYPGAQDGKFVPFVCPMDHVLSPAAWARAEQAYRDAAFPSRPDSASAARPARSPAPLAAARRVRPDGPRAAAGRATTRHDRRGGARGPRRVRARVGDRLAAAARPWAAMWCGRRWVARVNALSNNVLQVPQWCAKCYQPCAQELAKWLPPEEAKSSHGWLGGGGNFGASMSARRLRSKRELAC